VDPAAALDDFLRAAAALDERAGTPTAQAATDLAAGGLRVMQALADHAETPGLETTRDELARATAGLAVWLARRGATLNLLEPIVDALALIANRTFEPAALASLSDLMGEILDAVAPALREEASSTGPGHPWRLLNLNRGIVATRSHDPTRMEDAFLRLVRTLPGDAPRFFREGMGQMEALNYPAPVRAVVERYYRAWSERTVH
jgi:hypothetical protein